MTLDRPGIDLGGAPARPGLPQGGGPAEVILSFDVEEHWRIEAASALPRDPAREGYHRSRVAPATRWLLDCLERRGIRATFFVLGRVARDDPGLVRDIHRAGHEVASHGLDHRRIHRMDPDSFRGDVRESRDALEQVTGEAVVGYRAPTFSIVRRTSWALDVLADSGMLYDSSIYPVRHDRYGIPDAPRAPFVARGARREILEFPPATLRLPGLTLPVGGGGYFRLLPPSLMEAALRQVRREGRPPVAMLYFHPWEFDPDQERLPLRPLNRYRTYVGLGRSRGRLETLLARHRFARAVDVARRLDRRRHELTSFDPSA